MGRRHHSRERLRVAMLAPPCLPVPPQRYGGTELVVAELIDGLVDRGHEVVLFAAPGSTGGYRHLCEVRVTVPQPVWPPDDTQELEHVQRAFEAIAADPQSFDVIHVHCPTGVALAERVGAPVVCTLHHAREAPYSALYAAHPDVHYVGISARQLELEAPLPRAEVVHHGLEPERYPLGVSPG